MNYFLENKIFSITFDVDWAKDAIIEDLINLVTQYNCKTTWFITHPSSLWNQLTNDTHKFELGIHPNFLPNSTQGSSLEEIIDYLLKTVHKPYVFRMHSLHQSIPLLSKLRDYSGIDIDSSLFLPETPYLMPLQHLTANSVLYRVPVFWADDYELLKRDFSFLEPGRIETPGIKVFLFHPIHIFLNTPNPAYYEQFKNKKNLSPTDRYTGFGVRDILKNLLEYLAREGRKLNSLSDIVEQYKLCNKGKISSG